MKPSIKQLAARDPSLATLLGVNAPSNGDFGSDQNGYTPEFGGSGRDYEFGEDAPTPENMAQAWRDKVATRQRERLLEPNRGSDVKVQRYAFGVSQSLTLSTPIALNLSGQPETNFRPQRITCNAPLPAFCRIDSVKVANVGVIVGGAVDAFDFTADGSDQSLDVPTLSPANRVSVTGQYSGLLPSGGYLTATAFLFITSFKGPSTMAG